MPQAYLFGDMNSGFSDDHQVADYRIHSSPILDEGIEFHPLRIFLNGGDSVQYILNPELPIPMWHGQPP